MDCTGSYPVDGASWLLLAKDPVWSKPLFSRGILEPVFYYCSIFSAFIFETMIREACTGRLERLWPGDFLLIYPKLVESFFAIL